MQLRETLAQLAASIGPVTPDMVACGIVVGTWRDAIEPLHRHLADHEMAYTNIATTRAIASSCTSDSVDWDGVSTTLLDPDRVILAGRTARQVAGDAWNQLHDAIAERLEDAQRLTAIAHAGWALTVCSNWWGMPAYRDQVQGLLKTGRVTRWMGTDHDLADALMNDPLSVQLDVWEQIVGGNGLGWLDKK